MSVSRHNASVFICEYVFDYGLSTWLDRPMIPEKVIAEKECFDVDREELDRLPTGKDNDKCTVFKMQDCKEYSIKILNHDGRRVCADVFVDGNLIGKFAVEPFSSVTVRRPVDSDEGTMLTFNNSNSSSSSKSNDEKIDPHLGHIRVKVTPELNIHPKIPLFATKDDEVMECIDIRTNEPVSPLVNGKCIEENATSGRPSKTRQQFVKSKPFWRGSLFETTIKIYFVPSS